MKYVNWIITAKCNLHCKHCIHGKDLHYKELAFKDKLEIIDTLRISGTEHIIFSSMEPLLSESFTDLLKYCRYAGIHTSVVTNGTLLNTQFIEELSKGFVDELVISLEGFGPETNDYIRGTGTYERIIKNLDHLIESHTPCKIYIEMCLSPHNLNDVRENLSEFLRTYPKIQVSFGRIYPVGSAKDYPELCFPQKKYVEAIESIIDCNLNNRERILIRNLGPFESEYLNKKYNLSLEVKPYNCNIFGGSVSIMPDGSITRCSPLLNKNILKNDELNLGRFSNLNNTINIGLKNSYLMTLACSECQYKNNCMPCLLNIPDLDKRDGIKDSCAYYRNHIEEIKDN